MECLSSSPPEKQKSIRELGKILPEELPVAFLSLGEQEAFKQTFKSVSVLSWNRIACYGRSSPAPACTAGFDAVTGIQWNHKAPWNLCLVYVRSLEECWKMRLQHSYSRQLPRRSTNATTMQPNIWSMVVCPRAIRS